MNNNITLKNKINNMLNKYSVHTKIGKSTTENKEYIFIYGTYRIECKFYINKIYIYIYSLKNKFNKIHFNIYFNGNFAEIKNVNKNFNNKLNKNYNPKNVINLIIKICKILKLNYIDLYDQSFFMCHGRKIDLNNFTLLKDHKSWYEKYFDFKLNNNSDILEFNKTLNILSKLTLQEVVEKVPYFEYIISNQNNQNHNVNGDMLLSEYLQHKLNKRQCKILYDNHILDEIFIEFDLLDLRGKPFRLIL